MATGWRSPPVRRVWRFIPHYVVLVTVLTAFSVVSASSSCNSFSAEQLLDRVDAHLSQCLPSPTHAAPLDAFKDALTAHVYQSAEQRPLSVVVFSRSPETLARFASAVSNAVAGDTTQVIDFEALLAAPQAVNHVLQSRIQRAIASTLRRCPTQRSLFVVRGVDRVARDRLPLLDTFLDPLNGERALLHDAATDRELDCRRSVFLFLYHMDAELPGAKWRDFLVSKWAHEQQETAATMVKEAFTPQALAGRFTGALQLPEDTADTAKEAAWPALCVSAAETATTKSGAESLGPSWADNVLAVGAFWSFVVFLAVLTVHKLSGAQTKSMSSHRTQQRPKLQLRVERTTKTTVQVHVTTPVALGAVRSIESPGVRNDNDEEAEIKQEKQAPVKKAGKKKAKPQTEAASPPSAASTPRKQPNKPKKKEEKVTSPQGTRRSRRLKKA